MVSLACSDIPGLPRGHAHGVLSIIWNRLTTPSYTVSTRCTRSLRGLQLSSLLHVLTLSPGRYHHAICHPFRYKAMSGPCQAGLLIGFVWVTSSLMALLPLLFAMGLSTP